MSVWMIAGSVVVGLVVVMAIAGQSAGGVPGNEDHRILLFSEGKNYRATFQPIVDAFVRMGQRVTYVTCEADDPVLAMKGDLVDARFIGKGQLGYARLRYFRARVMLATTPNIGAPGFPVARPKGVKTMAHVCHAVAGLGNYHKYSLDRYDVVLMPGEFMRDEVRRIERLRSLPEKRCEPVGLPYLDAMVAKARRKDGRSNPPVVLVAPSWGTKNFLKYTGSEFIRVLATAGYSVILRPHPQSWISEVKFFDDLTRELSAFPNVVVDREVDGSASLAQADVLVSGRSAVRFDFAFLYEKPVVSVSIPFPADHQYEFADLGKTWEDDAEHALGPVIDPKMPASEIVDVVSRALEFAPRDIASLRDQSVTHFGRSADVVASWCVRLAEGDQNGVENARS